MTANGEFEANDRVLDCVWTYGAGTVEHVYDNGIVSVRWADGAACLMAPHQIAHLPVRIPLEVL